MRSKFLVSAAIAAVGVFGSFVTLAHAAGAKGKDKDAKPKPLELHADDKSIKKQTQWEDNVMGPDSTRSELDKIARARAINEKAMQDKQDKEKQSAIEAEAPAPKAVPAPSKKNAKSEVSLIAPEKNEPSHAHEISPKLETAAAQAPVPTAKPADDKFIDKLLREDSPSKKRASSANDKELESLLAGVGKDKPAGRKRGDSVDALLKSADKGPAMPEPRAQSGGLPEWAKQPEIAPTAGPTPPSPLAAKPTPKAPSSGVIQVVQGAAGNAPAVVQSAKPAPVAAARPGRKGAAAKPAPATWSDPFADKRPVASASKKEAASRPSASTETGWNDPFASEPETRKPIHRGTPAAATSAPAAPASAPKKSEPAARPAGNAGWKDPFTKAPSEPARAQGQGAIAMREPNKGEGSKWEVAAHRPTARSSQTRVAGGWGVLKKRAR
jgi:hypothetical protein